MVREEGGLLTIFNNSFFIQNANGFIDWGLLSPHGANTQEGPVNIKRAHHNKSRIGSFPW